MTPDLTLDLTPDRRSITPHLRVALIAAAALLALTLTACNPTPPPPKTSAVPLLTTGGKA